jgi:hypothetical protein
MEKINSEAGLKAAILKLEARQADDGKMLKEQLNSTYESMRPVNLIKSTFHEVAASEALKDKIVNASIGLAAGYVAEKLFEGVTSGPLKKLLGAGLMFGVTNVVTKNPDIVKSLAKGFFKIIIGKPRERRQVTV